MDKDVKVAAAEEATVYAEVVPVSRSGERGENENSAVNGIDDGECPVIYATLDFNWRKGRVDVVCLNLTVWALTFAIQQVESSAKTMLAN